MSGTTKITLRPPPHRDYLTGYPGVPSCDPAQLNTVPSDPIVSLPLLLRPPAHLSGTVEVRPSAKDTVKARWLRVELEKVEVIPAAGGKTGLPGTRFDGRATFIELIGNGPGTLWEAPGGGEAKSLKESQGKKKKGDEDEEGWEAIPEGNYPFRIPLPEGLPPSTEVDSKGSGISYQLVATLCGKGKKGILKATAKLAMTTSSAPVTLLKADLLPTWPTYCPLLPPALYGAVPWGSAAGPTTGEIREARLAIQGDGVDGRTGSGGDLIMRCTRETGAFGPGDLVRLLVQLVWSGSSPLKLTRLESVLLETLTFRYPASSGALSVDPSPPRVTPIVTASANPTPDLTGAPTPFAVLYQNEPVGFELAEKIPSAHTRVTLRTAKHIDVAYHLRIGAVIEGGEELSVDHWSVLVGGVGSREAKGLMEEIGWVEGLCDRPRPPGDGGPDASAPAATVVSQPPRVAPTPLVQSPVSGSSPSSIGPLWISSSTTSHSWLIRCEMLCGFATRQS